MKLHTTLRNNMLDEITTFAGAGAILSIYSGTQPGGGGSITTLLAELTCDVTAFASAAATGVLTLNGITADSAADNTGVATWWRITTDPAGNWVMDGDITTIGGGGDMQLDSTSIVVSGTVSMTGPNTITAPNAA